MKKIVLSLITAVAIATTANAQIAIAPELGLNMSNLTGKSDGFTVKTGMKAGVAVGAVVDLGITDNIYFQPGLFYEMTGCKFTEAPNGKYSLNTITVPLNFQYKTGEEGGNRFFVGVGPYIAFNVSGKYEFDATTNSPARSGSLKIGSAKPDPLTFEGGDDIKALDFGAGANIGYLLANGFFVRVHYQMGFANLNTIGNSDNTIKASALGVTVGYYLGGKKTKSKTKTKMK